MRKIVLIIIVFSGLLLLNARGVESKAINNGVLDIQHEKVLAIHNNYRIQEVIDGYLLTKEEEIKYVYKNVDIFNIEEQYLAHAQDKNFLYLISKKISEVVLRKINKNNKTIKETKLDIEQIGSLMLNNEELIIVGSNQNDAIISKYTTDLKHYHTYYYGGLGEEHFLKIYLSNNYYYVIGTKDAISENSPFMNVGSINEKKIFLTKINDKGLIVNTCYFNHDEKIEELIDSDFLEGKILLNIRADNNNHLYIIDSNLNREDYFTNQGDQKNVVLFNNNCECLMIETQDKTLLKLKNETKYELDINEPIEYAVITDNALNVYYYQDNYLYQSTIYQYKIEHQEDIIINILNGDFDVNMNMNDLKEIKISSIIHKIDLVLEATTPFFNKQINGKYEALFRIKINDKKSFLLKNNIIIEEYVNVYADHIYPIGYKLKFFGYGLLNDKTVISGMSLSDEGQHKFVISDANGQKQKITFYVVEGYYNKEEEWPDADYTINQDQVLKIMINNYSTEEIKEIYINEQSTPFTVEDNQVVVELNDFSEKGVYQYLINKIVYQDEELEINKKISVKVLKETPKVQIKEQEEENFSLDINLIDNDKAIKDLTFEIYEQDKLLEIQHTYLKEYNLFVGNIYKDKKYKIKAFLIYDLGNKELKKTEIFTTILNFKEGNYELGKVDISENHSQIKLKLSTNNSNLTIDTLMIGTTELKEKYQIVSDYSPIYISLGISVIIVIIGGGYYYYKKQHKK